MLEQYLFTLDGLRNQCIRTLSCCFMLLLSPQVFCGEVGQPNSTSSTEAVLRDDSVSNFSSGTGHGTDQNLRTRARPTGASEEEEEDEDLAGRGRYMARMLKGNQEKIDIKAVRAAEHKRVVMMSDMSLTSTATQTASALSWNEIGPDNIGGRVRSMAFHPTISGRLFAGSVGGGIWRSDNFGATWSQIGSQLTNLAVTHIVIASSNPNYMYAATGEGFDGAIDAYQGNGVFRSIDGGTTWQALTSTDPQNNFSWFTVGRLWVNPTNPNIVLAGTFGTVYKSIDGGISWNPKVSRANVTACDFTSNPTNPNQILVGYCNGNADRSADGGDSWSAVPSIPAFTRSVFAWSTSSPNIVYASNQNSQVGSLYKSSDFGQTFNLVNSSVNSNIGNALFQSNYDSCIFVDPANANNIAVGAVHFVRSIDGGASFQQAFTSLHDDYHTIVAPPGYNTSSNPNLYIGGDGGVLRNALIFQPSFTTDVHGGWTSLSNGLRITQFYQISANANWINGGTQDNGTLSWSRSTSGAGMNWNIVYIGADGGYAPVGGDANRTYLFGTSQTLKPYREDPSGVFGPLSNGLSDYGLGDFISPLMLDSTPSNTRLLAGAQNLWTYSSPFGSTGAWQVLAPNSAFGGGTVDLIGMSPTNDSILWLASSGQLYKSTNATTANPTFSLINGLSDGFTSIHVSAFDPNTVFVTSGGYVTGNIHKTTDGGAHWLDISSNLPAQPVFDIAQSLWDAQTLYIGSSTGIYASGDGGSSWTPVLGGPQNATTLSLAWQGYVLVAATHGRGAFLGSYFSNNVAISMSHGAFTQGQQNATYSITVHNVGSSATSGQISVTENLPSGLTFATTGAMAGLGWNCSLPPTCTRSDSLASNASYPPIVVTVNVASNAAPTIINSASVVGPDANTVAANDNTATDNTTVAQLPDLTVGISASPSTWLQGQNRAPGAEIGPEYRITVTNIGGGTTNGSQVTVSDVLPTGITLMSAQGVGWNCVGTTCSRQDVLGPGASYPVLELIVSVSANAPNSVTDTVTISGGGDTVPSDNNASVTQTIQPAAAPSLSKTHVGNFSHGQTNAQYTLTVTDIGSLGLPSSQNVAVSDTPPTGLTITSMNGTGWACAAQGCTRTGPLAVGASFPPITVHVIVATDAPSSVINSADAAFGAKGSIRRTTATDQTTISP